MRFLTNGKRDISRIAPKLNDDDDQSEDTEQFCTYPESIETTHVVRTLVLHSQLEEPGCR